MDAGGLWARGTAGVSDGMLVGQAAVVGWPAKDVEVNRLDVELVRVGLCLEGADVGGAVDDPRQAPLIRSEIDRRAAAMARRRPATKRPCG